MSYSTHLPIVLFDGQNNEPVTVRLIITGQVFTGEDWPRLHCGGCKEFKVFTELLAFAPEKDNTVLSLFQCDRCIACQPRLAPVIHLRKKMPVRCEMIRGDDASPFRWFDEKKRRWLAISNLQFRFMNKTKRPMELRLQPYIERAVAHDGTPYAR